VRTGSGWESLGFVLDTSKIAPVRRKRIKKILNQKIMQLHDIVADIDSLLTEMETDFYRVTIFGSARIDSKSPYYEEVENLAEGLAMKGVDIVTGGGPGLMEAANRGAQKGSKGARSIGLPIQLPFEPDSNSHIDVKSEHKRFSSRLDEFLRISHAVVVTQGGIGTLLELFYTWQLMQVNHIKPRPFFLLGTGAMWPSFMQWMEDWPKKLGLISQSDLKRIIITKSVAEILDRLDPEIQEFRKLQFSRRKGDKSKN
jgi:uncharacterized protein (TIGR00730 family)